MAFPVAHLSLHAKERLPQRSCLTEAALLHLLNQQFGRRVGCSKVRPHLMHRLYWSPVDDAFYVLVQDAFDGTVLTILTLGMYCAHFPRNVTWQTMAKVTNAMIIAGYAPADRWCSAYAPKSVLVYATVSGFVQPLALGSWREMVLQPDLSVLGSRRSFWGWVAEKLSSRGASLAQLEWVTARLPGGDHQHLSYGC